MWFTTTSAATFQSLGSLDPLRAAWPRAMWRTSWASRKLSASLPLCMKGSRYLGLTTSRL